MFEKPYINLLIRFSRTNFTGQLWFEDPDKNYDLKTQTIVS